MRTSSDSIIAGVLEKLALADAPAQPPAAAAPSRQAAPRPRHSLRPDFPAEFASGPDLDDSRDSATPERRGAEFWTLPGFCWDARVTTSFGDLPAQALRVRDPVRTASGGYLQVKWTDEIKLDEGFLAGFPDAHPVTITAGSLGAGLPRNDLTVSPHQRVAVGDGAFRTEFRMARDLTGRPGILRRPQLPLRYFLFHCGEPTQVMVEGVWVTVAP